LNMNDSHILSCASDLQRDLGVVFVSTCCRYSSLGPAKQTKLWLQPKI
jgi:hypothetical protein